MVEISFNVDENNKVIASFPENLSGSIKFNVNDKTFKQMFNDLLPFKFENNDLIIDVDKQEYESLENQILKLEQKLKDTNDKVTEAMEYKLRDESIPSELQQVLDDRQSWREQIVTLQVELNSLN